MDNIGFWKFKILKILDFENTRLWKYPILEIQDFENTEFWKFKILKIPDFGDSRFWKYSILEIQDFENTGFLEIQGFENTQFWKFKILKILVLENFNFLKFLRFFRKFWTYTKKFLTKILIKYFALIFFFTRIDRSRWELFKNMFFCHNLELFLCELMVNQKIEKNRKKISKNPPNRWFSCVFFWVWSLFLVSFVHISQL